MKNKPIASLLWFQHSIIKKQDYDFCQCDCLLSSFCGLTEAKAFCHHPFSVGFIAWLASCPKWHKMGIHIWLSLTEILMTLLTLSGEILNFVFNHMESNREVLEMIAKFQQCHAFVFLTLNWRVWLNVV